MKKKIFTMLDPEWWFTTDRKLFTPVSHEDIKKGRVTPVDCSSTKKYIKSLQSKF